MKRKDEGIAYLMWFFGLHRFYLAKPLTALLFWAFPFLMVFMAYIADNWQLVLLSPSWYIWDFFLIPSMVKKYNNKQLYS